VRIVPSPRVEVGEVEGRALEDVLEREKRAFRAEKLRGLLRSRGGGAFEVRSRWGVLPSDGIRPRRAEARETDAVARAHLEDVLRGRV
jgi:hypothetical protein